MKKSFSFVLAVTLLTAWIVEDTYGRGRGGGGGGSRGGSARGGSFSGGSARSSSSRSASSSRGSSSRGGSARGGSVSGGSARGGSVSGGSARGGSVSGGSAQRGSVSGGSARGGSVSGGSARGGSVSGGTARGGSAQRGSVSGGTARAGSAQAGAIGGGQFQAGAGNYTKPSQNQLQGFLGLPSDGGFAGAGKGSASGDNFTVSKGGAAKGGTSGDLTGGAAVGGVQVTGPRGNTTTKGGAAAGVTDGTHTAAKVGTGTQVEGANRTVSGGKVAGGVAGPEGAVGGTLEAGRVSGDKGTLSKAGAAVGGATAGGLAAGAAADGRRVEAGTLEATRRDTANSVRDNWHNNYHEHHHHYDDRWHADNPGAWFVAGWTANTLWNGSSWNNTYGYVGTTASPVYYDYGNTVVYEDDTVYQDGQPVGSTTEYYDQAATIAATGQETATDAEPNAEDWLPLGVFAVTMEGQDDSSMLLQLAISKEGLIRGNFENMLTENVQPIHGSMDKETQRVAWTIGDNSKVVVETGLANLTMDEAPALVHTDTDEVKQVLLIRLPPPEEGETEAAAPPAQ